MNYRLFLIFLCFAFSCMTFVAHADKLCADSAKNWQCFGQVDVNYKTGQDVQHSKNVTSRMIFFENGEELIQVEADSIQMQYLVISSKLRLYSGFPKSNSEKKEIQQFLNTSQSLLATPLELLIHAYPSGPESVPDGTSTKTFSVYGAKPLQTITTTRSKSGHIAYLIGDEKALGTLSGNWDSQLAEPYPDDFSVIDWKHSAPFIFQNLLDARSSPLQHQNNRAKHD